MEMSNKKIEDIENEISIEIEEENENEIKHNIKLAMLRINDAENILKERKKDLEVLELSLLNGTFKIPTKFPTKFPLKLV